MNTSPKIIAIAPMMAYTDRHYRYLARIMTKHTQLYTEMVHSRAILHGDRSKLLAYSADEHPLALQVGGSEVKELAACAVIAADYGFAEINLNIGCPSERVQSGQFGACLFKQPELVASAVHAMKTAAKIPVTVKTRIAVDDFDQEHHLYRFIESVSEAGCELFIIHARKAWLKGLNPKQNRDLPPLNYPVVYQLKKDFPQLKIIINGGIKTISEIEQHLTWVDGVMIGREAYSNPYLLATFDQVFDGSDRSKIDRDSPIKSRTAVVMEYSQYVSAQLAENVPLRSLIKPIIGLFHAELGARTWRRFLSEHLLLNDHHILLRALDKLADNRFQQSTI